MDSIRAMRKFEAKYTGQYLADVIAAGKAEMVSAFTTRTQELVALEQQVKGLLAGEAVLTVDYVPYHCFAREVLKKKGRFGGGAGLVEEVAVILAKWRARDCHEAVLNRIRDEVFAIPAPAAP